MVQIVVSHGIFNFERLKYCEALEHVILPVFVLHEYCVGYANFALGVQSL